MIDRLKKIFGRKKDDHFIEAIELLQTINNRKLKHLHDCIDTICKSAKVPYQAPESFVTEYELKVFERLTGDKADILKKLLLKSFKETE